MINFPRDSLENALKFKLYGILKLCNLEVLFLVGKMLNK